MENPGLWRRGEGLCLGRLGAQCISHKGARPLGGRPGPLLLGPMFKDMGITTSALVDSEMYEHKALLHEPESILVGLSSPNG